MDEFEPDEHREMRRSVAFLCEVFLRGSNRFRNWKQFTSWTDQQATIAWSARDDLTSYRDVLELMEFLHPTVYAG